MAAPTPRRQARGRLSPPSETVIALLDGAEGSVGGVRGRPSRASGEGAMS